MNLTLRITSLFIRLLLVPLVLLLSAGAFAVSLGDELILSRLGDPVEVEIDVLQWEDMDLDRVQISAASREEYEVFKLTWLPVLEHLNFNLIGPDLNGNVRVLISSRDPLHEPFLELLLVLRWPGGSLRREYVLLFDPPGAPLAVVQPAVPAPEPVRAEPEPEVMVPAPAPIVTNLVQPPVQEPAPVTPEPRMNDAAEPVVNAQPEETAAVVAEPQSEETAAVVAEPQPEETAAVVAEPQPDEISAVVAEPQPRVVAFVAPEPAPQRSEVVDENAPDVEVPSAAMPVVPQAERIAAPILVPQVPEQTVAEAPPEEVVPDEAPPAQVVPENAPQVAPAPAPAVVAEQPIAEPPAEVVEQADARTQVAIDVEPLAPQVAATALDTSRRTYQVRSGDSLWNIARQFAPAGAGENIYQMLLGIHDLNRNSFINGNIALLKANALLQMPGDADIAAIDPGTAQVEFDRRWEAGTQRFDAAQRGEAIPLFIDETAADEPAPIEPDLPPGTEAPRLAADDSGLIMVSATSAAQPLQLAPAGEASIEPAALPSTQDAPAASVARNASVVETASGNPEVTSAAEGFDSGAVMLAPTNAVQTSTPPAPALDSARVVIVTAELETEVVAMRARREAAEAVARQLQESLQRAQAERAAQTDLLAPQNLPLAAGALALIAALVAGVVFMLKIAGELRTVRIGNDRAFASARSLPTRLDATRMNPVLAAQARTEPTWMESRAKTPEPRDPQDPTQIEVVEMEPEAVNAATASSDHEANPDDLFARMDNMLDAAQKSPQK